MAKKELSKLRQLNANLQKAGYVTKMNNPTHWVSTGNYAMNYRLTGRFDRGICNRRTTLLWGESGTGKTFLSSNLCANIQKAGYTIIYIDSEDSISEDYMEKVGIELDEDHFIPVLADTISEAEKQLKMIFEMFPENGDDKICIVIDSIAGLSTDSQVENFKKGQSKGDQGQFAKQMKLFIKMLNKQISKRDAYCIMVTHAYQNQDMLNGEGKWICTGGKGFQFFPSFSILLEKATLKKSDDDRVDNDKALKGVRIKGTCTKTRFTAPKQKFELHVPYEVGINPYDGVMDILKEDSIVGQHGSWYSYPSPETGEDVKFQAKHLPDHFDNICKIVEEMAEPLEELDDDEVNEKLSAKDDD